MHILVLKHTKIRDYYNYLIWENKRPGALKFQTDSESHENEGKFRRPSGALIAPPRPFEQ